MTRRATSAQSVSLDVHHHDCDHVEAGEPVVLSVIKHSPNAACITSVCARETCVRWAADAITNSCNDVKAQVAQSSRVRH